MLNKLIDNLTQVVLSDGLQPQLLKHNRMDFSLSSDQLRNSDS